jgi:hypothetical protein
VWILAGREVPVNVVTCSRGYRGLAETVGGDGTPAGDGDGGAVVVVVLVGAGVEAVGVVVVVVETGDVPPVLDRVVVVVVETGDVPPVLDRGEGLVDEVGVGDTVGVSVGVTAMPSPFTNV